MLPKRRRRKRRRTLNSQQLPWNVTGAHDNENVVLTGNILPWTVVCRNHQNNILPKCIEKIQNNQFSIQKTIVPNLREAYELLLKLGNFKVMDSSIVSLDDLLPSPELWPTLCEQLTQKLLDDPTIVWYTDDNLVIKPVLKLISLRSRKTLSVSDSEIDLKKKASYKKSHTVSIHDEVAVWVPWTLDSKELTRFEQHIIRQNNLCGGKCFTYRTSGNKKKAIQLALQHTIRVLEPYQIYVITDIITSFLSQNQTIESSKKSDQSENNRLKGQWFRFKPEMAASIKFDKNDQPIFNDVLPITTENHERWWNMDSRVKDIVPVLKGLSAQLEVKWNRGWELHITYAEEISPVLEKILSSTDDEHIMTYAVFEKQVIGGLVLLRFFKGRIECDIDFPLDQFPIIINNDRCESKTVEIYLQTIIGYLFNIQIHHLLTKPMISKIIDSMAIDREILEDMLAGAYVEKKLPEFMDQRSFLLTKINHPNLAEIKAKLQNEKCLTSSEINKLSLLTGGITPITKQAIRIIQSPKITALRRLRINQITAFYRGKLPPDKLRILEDIVNNQLAGHIQKHHVETCIELTGKHPNALIKQRRRRYHYSPSRLHRRRPLKIYTVTSFQRVTDLQSTKKRIITLMKKLRIPDIFLSKTQSELCSIYTRLREAYGTWKFEQEQDNPWFRYTPSIMKNQIVGTPDEQINVLRYMFLLEIIQIKSSGFDWKPYVCL